MMYVHMVTADWQLGTRYMQNFRALLALADGESIAIWGVDAEWKKNDEAAPEFNGLYIMYQYTPYGM